MPSATRIARAAVVLAAILATLATASVAAAQGPPPDVPPPPPGTEHPPPGEQPTDPEPPTEDPEPPPPVIDDPPPSPEDGPTTPDPEPVALTGTTKLRGRMLTVGLSCTRSGRVTVAYRGKRAGAAKFRCEDSEATARVRLGRKVVRQIKRSAKGTLKVTARAGAHRVTRTLELSHGEARLSAWPRGPHGYFNATGYCDYSLERGRALYSFTGLLTSPLAGGDRYWLRFWAYTHEGGGWQRMTDWLGPHDVPQQGQSGFTWASYNLFYPARKKWVAGYMEVWSYRHGKAFGDYLQADQLGGGGITTTSGVWCYSQV